MNSLWEIAALTGWAVLLLNLALTLRLVRWLRVYRETERLDSELARPSRPATVDLAL